MTTEGKKERINLILKLTIMTLFTTGFIIFCYPFVANVFNNYYAQKTFSKNEAEMTAKAREEQEVNKKKLEQLNKNLLESTNSLNNPGMGLIEDIFEEVASGNEERERDYYAEHHVGAIFIPKIDVSLPLFDETNRFLLDKGATVLQGSSFPIGGNNTHSVISAHSGLPSKKMFTDLEQLKIGDKFYISIVGDKIAYQIDDIQTVLPTDSDKLVIQSERDLVTLLTCTPYGVNTHRLLVTGQRIPYETSMELEIRKTQKKIERHFKLYLILVPLFLGQILYWVYRKIIYYRSTKRTYNFSFYVLKNGRPKAGVSFMLASSKKSFGRATKNKVVKSESDGRVCFKNIPGGLYWVKAIDCQVPLLKGYVRCLSDKKFVVKIRHSKLAYRKRRRRGFFIERR